MVYVERILKKTGWSSIISEIIFAILGIILITNPTRTLKVVSYVLGAMLIGTGIYKIISYLYNGKNNIYNYELAYGLITIILGIITIAYSSQIIAIFRIIIGLWITYSAIIRINISMRLKVINSNMWLYSFIMALLMLMGGLFVIFNSNTILVTIGVIILIYSILDIIESIIFMKNMNKLIK